jgi:ribosomal protein S18 acetylase RimI-like enzyme
MHINGPVFNVEKQCERVLRTLPGWFGIEDSLLEYARNTNHLTTFVAEDAGVVVAFISLQQHFPTAWEVNCIAVAATHRGQGLGQHLHFKAEDWLVSRAASVVQVKTLAASHPSVNYAQTRAFYEAIGYTSMEVFPTLWAPHLPVLQLIKVLANHP